LHTSYYAHFDLFTNTLIIHISLILLLIPHIIIIQHVDRYLRLKRQKKLNTKTPGVAIIEYEDGETEMVNLHVETFRNYQEDDDEDDNDSDTNNNRQINNFDLIIKDGMIELLWPLADIFFPCKVISYTKLKSSQGGSKKRSRKTVDDNVKGHDDSKMESIPKQKKYKDDEKFGARQQQLKSADEEEQMNSDLFSESGNDRESVRNISDDSIDNYDSDRLVDRLNHDNPLFDDEPKYDSSDNDDDEEESDSDSNEGHADSNKQNHPVSYSDNNQTRKLTFEEQWKLKLQRTQEMMNREGRDKSQMSGLMARQL